jgi:glycosidase
MVWEPRYRDDSMTEWYKALIRVRKEHPCILEGDLTQHAHDESGLITMVRQTKDERFVLVFHGKDEDVSLSLYKDRIDLLTGKPFCGTLGPYGAVVFMM